MTLPLVWIACLPALAGGFGDTDDTDPFVDTDPVLDTDTDPSVEADTDTDTDADADTDSDTDTDADSDSDADTAPGTRASTLAGEQGGGPWEEGECGCASGASGVSAALLVPLALMVRRRRG